MKSFEPWVMHFLQILLILFTLASSQTPGNEGPSCGQTERSSFYLEVAVDMINKAKLHYPASSMIVREKVSSPLDCADLLRNGNKTNGVYTIWPKNRLTENQPLNVFCDMDTDGGGWTVLQRRGPFNRSSDFFFKDWVSYKNGFGEIEKDFWIGNDNLFALTNQRLYSIRFDLMDMNGVKKYALFDTFWIDDEYNKNTLHILGYSGNAGDSMILNHNKRKFSTKDQDNDDYKEGSCAEKYKGGWWYNSCLSSNLNGLYLTANGKGGLYWSGWQVTDISLKTTEMKIRPKHFKI